MEKQLLVFLISITLSGVAHAKAKKPLDLPVCQVARAKTAYTNVIKIPEQVKTHITAYKKSWTDLCDRKASASVHETLRMAKALEEEFKPVLSSTSSKTADGKIDWKKTEAVHDYLQKDLPKFVPAFDGSIIEYEYFQPRFSEFKEVAKYGNAEDKLFFQLHADLRGNGTLSPWYAQTWDYGGCLRFGEYDWIQAFQTLRKAKKIKTPQYRKIISELEGSLNQTLDGLYFEFSDKKFNKICTCKKKDAVRADLEKLVAYLNRNKSNPKLAAKLQKTLKAIEAGKIPVKSEAEKHCSGG